MSKDTPLMLQYNKIKSKYPETVLLFRIGDFFETFNDDAVITSKICGITLTKRNSGAAQEAPLAGFPHHQLDTYLTKLVKAGCRVAVCDQVEDSKQAKGIVKREVVEVVTPGVSLYDKLLDSKKNNYIASIYVLEPKNLKNKFSSNFININSNINIIAGIAFCDVSTGEFFVGEISLNKISEILDTYLPSEIIYSKEQKDTIIKILENKPYKIAETRLEDWIFELNFTKELLLRHFETRNFKGFGIDDMKVGISAAGSVLHYVSETQKSQLLQINSIKLLKISDFMILDYPTRRNLEILHTVEGEKHGSLLTLLDKTLTPPGSRLLKRWLNQPLNKLESIYERLNAVESLVLNSDKLEQLRTLLYNLGDLERLISRIASGKASTRDVVALAFNLERIPKIQKIFNLLNNNSLNKISTLLAPLEEVVKIIRDSFLDDPAIHFGNGHIFKAGFNPELDSYVQAKFNAKHWIAKYQEQERENTKISSLKVGFNNVFGYYIEVTNTHISKTPENYQRKQTLTNAERYITPELKEFEDKILNAEIKIIEIESNLFSNIKLKLSNYIEEIQNNARLLAKIDCLQSFAKTAIDYNYIKPTIDKSEIIEIKNGRHPVVEQLLPLGEKFTPNDTILDSNHEQIHIITGPNMAGKSCYLRQVALIILLGQIGSYVPAESARFGLIDRIFTRVGAQDNITMGESTFLVEMQEVANILNNATRTSLILLDEVGRGTATFDGVSIAWSIAEYLHNITSAKTLFATHYHELNELEDKYDKIANYKVEVIESNNNILFSHKVTRGSSDHSFGIYVANIAGLPKAVIKRADEIMKDLENSSYDTNNSTSKLFDNKKLSAESKKISAKKKILDSGQLSIFEFHNDDDLREKLQSIDINTITPIEALQRLDELIKEI